MPSTTANPTALGITKSSVSEKSPDHAEALPADEAEAFRRRRNDRYRMRNYIGDLLGSDANVAKCGWSARPDGNGGTANIELRQSGEGAYMSGVLNCSSPWICPVCTPKIMTRRGQIIDRVMEAVDRNGGTTLFVTLTCRHTAWDDPDDLVAMMTAAFGELLSGRAWHGDSKAEIARKQERDRTNATRCTRRRGRPPAPIRWGKSRELGYVGMVRVVEMSHGCHGFHPHVHAALVFDRQLTDSEVLLFTYWLQRRWTAHLYQLTGRRVDPARACDVRRWTTEKGEEERLGWYVTKIAHGWSLGSELTATDQKEAKGRSRNPAQLAAEYVISRGTDRKTGAILRQIHQATSGKKAYYISPKLSAWCGLNDDEETDEDIANQDQDGEAVAEIATTVWHQVRRLHAVADLLDGAEANGLTGALEALWNLGLPVQATERPGGQPPLIEFAAAWHFRRCGDTQRSNQHLGKEQRQ